MQFDEFQHEFDKLLSTEDERERSARFTEIAAKDLSTDQNAIVTISQASFQLRHRAALSAIELLRNIAPLELDPAVRGVYYNVLSYSLHELERYEEAIQSANEVIKLEEASVSADIRGEAYAHIGAALAELGRLKEATEALEKAEQFPLDEEIQLSVALYRAAVLEAIGDFNGALMQLDHAQSMTGAFASREVTFRKGRILGRTGHPSEALVLLKQAKRLPSDGDTTAEEIDRAIDSLSGKRR